jgi:hypothetical protein
MSDLRKFRWGFVGGLVAFPVGLTLGGLTTQVDWLVSAMGTEWSVYKFSVAGCVMAGFVIGQELYKDVARQQSHDDQPASSEF